MRTPSASLKRTLLTVLCGMAWSLPLTQAARAETPDAPFSTASSRIDNLRFTLVDLAPDDGIAPTLRVNGVLVGAITSSGTPVLDPASTPYDAWFHASASTSRQVLPGVIPLQTGSGSQFGAPDGSASIQAGLSAMSASVQLRRQDLAAGRYTSPTDVLDLSRPGPDGTPLQASLTRVGSFAEITAERQALGHAYQGHLSGEPEQQNAHLVLQLSPHTRLVIEGTATAGVTADRAPLASAFLPAGELPPIGGDLPAPGVHPYQFVLQQQGQGIAEAYVGIGLGDSPESLAAAMRARGDAGFSLQSSLGYDHQQFYKATSPDGWEGVASPDTLQTLSQTRDWSLSQVNDGHGVALLYLGLATRAEARQLHTYEAVSGELTVTAVPEPAGFALAVAGLAPVGWAIRRRARRRLQAR